METDDAPASSPLIDYKDAWSVERACGEIERLRGTHFDPEVADAIPVT